MQVAGDAPLRVLVFGPAAQAVGASSVSVRLPVGATAAMVLQELGAQHPSLVFALTHARLAVNHEVVAANAPVRAGDEVALIALVDGG